MRWSFGIFARDNMNAAKFDVNSFFRFWEMKKEFRFKQNIALLRYFNGVKAYVDRKLLKS